MQHIDIVLDSRNHDRKNVYDVTLPIHDITSTHAQVQSAHVPMSRPIIHEGTALLVIYDYMGIRHNLRIPHGDYTKCPERLCQGLNHVLNALSGQAITFQYEPLSNAICVMSKKQFALGWNDCSALAKLLGFAPILQDACIDFTCGSFVAHAKYPVYLDGNKYIKLVIPQIAMAPLCIMTGSGIHCPMVPVIEHDIMTSDVLTVTFLDEYNNPYDFHGQDHVVVLRLFCV